MSQEPHRLIQQQSNQGSANNLPKRRRSGSSKSDISVKSVKLVKSAFTSLNQFLSNQGE